MTNANPAGMNCTVTSNQIKLTAITFAHILVQRASWRNILDIAAYGDFLRKPEAPRSAPITTLQGQFYRALSAAETDEYRLFTDTLDEHGLTLLENEMAVLVSRLTESTRKAGQNS